jgi:hypothetical protein
VNPLIFRLDVPDALPEVILLRDNIELVPIKG